jgi:hypothetical protein
VGLISMRKAPSWQLCSVLHPRLIITARVHHIVRRFYYTILIGRSNMISSSQTCSIHVDQLQAYSVPHAMQGGACSIAKSQTISHCEMRPSIHGNMRKYCAAHMPPGDVGLTEKASHLESSRERLEEWTEAFKQRTQARDFINSPRHRLDCRSVCPVLRFVNMLVNTLSRGLRVHSV